MSKRSRPIPLPRSDSPVDFSLGPLDLAPRLLGHILTTRFEGVVTSGRIVEVEAYREDDPAAHTFAGKTKRNASMYLDGGHLYVYFTYGMHYCANIVAGEAGRGEGVLLRGIEPIEGIDVMRRRRGPKPKDRDLANGPAKLAVALGIGADQDGLDIRAPDSPVRLLPGTPPDPADILRTPRIGISKGVDRMWRWVVAGDRRQT